MKTSTRIALLLAALALPGTACAKPDPAEVHREAGKEALNNGDWAKAIDEFDKSLAVDPKQEDIWKRKAYAHMQAGDTDKCEAALIKRAELLPEPAKKAEVYRDIAGVYMGKQQNDKAEPWLAKAVEADPNDDSSLQWLGEIYSQRGGARDMKATPVPEKLEKAIGYYDKLIKVKPDVGTGYLNKRIAINRLMDWEKKAQQTSEQDLQAATTAKDQDKITAAQAEVDKHKARIEDLKKQFDEMTKKLTDLAKNPPPAAK